MRIIKIGLLGIVGIIFTSIQCQTSPFQDEMQKVADNNGVVGLSVLSVCNGEILDSFYSGLSDIGRNVKVTEKTRYRVASVSKHVATIGLM